MKYKVRMSIFLFWVCVMLSGCGKGSFEGITQEKNNFELGIQEELLSTLANTEEAIESIEVIDDGGFTCDKIGTYNVTYKLINKKGNTKEVQYKYTVDDTIAPDIEISVDNIYVELGEELSIEQYVSVSDKSETHIEVEGEVNLNEEGEYQLDILAVDSSGNKSEKKNITIYVVDRRQCDIRKAKWGDPADVVKQFEKEKLVFEGPNDNQYVLVYEYSLEGLDTTINYIFNSEGKLGEVYYIVTEKCTNYNSYIMFFDSVEKKLTEKYGNPTEDYEYKGRLYKYAADKGEALQIGEYTLMDIWDLDDEKIALTCSNMSGLLVCVNYTSKQYFEEHESDDF